MRWFREGLDSSSDAVHEPFQPADVRPGDPVSAQVTVAGNGAAGEHLLPVWRISPFGIELLDLADPLPVDLDSEVDLVIALGDRTGSARGRVVKKGSRGDGRRLIGIRWHEDIAPAHDGEDRRNVARWPSGGEFHPTGVAPSPAEFEDSLFFRVRDLSRDGMQIVTSMRNKFLVPGLVLPAKVSIPTIGELDLGLEVLHSRVVADDGSHHLAAGTRIREASPRDLQAMGQYLLQFGPAGTPQELKQSGLRVQSCAKAVSFSCVRGLDEYQQVLKLRKTAYVGAEKLDPDVFTQETSDDFDTRARILIARHRGRVVASMRLMFHGPDDPMEHEQYAELPASLPPREEMIEITRVCTDPAYRGNDLLFGLFRHGVATTLQSGRRWILGSSTAKLLGLYRRIGCQVTDVRYRHEFLGDEEHTIFIGDVHRALTGGGVGPFVWNGMFAGMWSYMDLDEIIRVGPGARARLKVYRLLGPLARRMIRRRSERPRPQKQRTSA